MKLIFIFQFLLFGIFLNSQSNNYINYNIQNGLISNNVYSIEQDSKGFIWATTDKGVVKYDGLRYEIFTIEDGLASNDNFSMLIDSKDNIWLYSFISISKINNNNEISIFGDTKSYYAQFIINSKDQIYFVVRDSTSRDGIFGRYSFFYLSNDQLIKMNDTDYWNKSMAHTSYAFFYNDILYLINFNLNTGNFEAFYRYDESLNLMIKDSNLINIPHIPLIGRSKHVAEFVKINDSISIVLAENNFRLFKNNTLNPTKTYPLDYSKFTNNNSKSFYDDLIVILDNAIYLFNTNNDSWSLFSDKKKSTGLLKDKEGNIWISTLGEGIFKYSGYSKDFGVLNNKFITNEKIHKINGFKNNAVWVATSENLIKNIKGDEIYHPTELKDIRFLEVEGDDVYFGGSNAVFKNRQKFGELGFKNICLTNDTILFATTFGVLFRSKKDIESIFTIFDIQNRNNSERMYAVLLQSGIFYSGNQQGLYWGVPTKDELIPICLDDEVESVSVNQIYNTSNGDIWVSTEGNGVYVVRDKETIKHFLPELLDGNVHSLKIDEQDQVWISTRRGINKIFQDGDRYVVKSYTSFHGLPSDYVFDTYCYKDTLYAATDEGLVKIDMHAMDEMDFSHTPPVYILKAQMIAKEASATTLALDTTGYFTSTQNTFTFEYTGISYRSNGNVSFEYRLDPLIPEWRLTSNDNITFDNLKPGTYTFEVQAINAIGIKSAAPANYSFTIAKHFTQTFWFIGGCSLLGAMAIGYLVFLYSENRRKKVEDTAQNQKIITELRLKSLQAQMNPHFIFNSLNAIQQFINVENPRAANDYLARFARLMRLYLGGSENQFITLEQEMEVLDLYCKLEHLRFEDKFKYEIKIDPGLGINKVMVPAMLLQPHVENAIKHGLIPSKNDNNFLEISVYAVKGGIMCQIIDNGIGRTASFDIKKKAPSQHKSLGNKISKERLEVIRSLNLANITEEVSDIMDGGDVCGTRVQIFIGVDNNK